MKAVPQLLPVNQVEHFYRGGERIARFRRAGAPAGPYCPEEWIASMTTMTSDPGRGLSTLADGTLLRDAVEADPEDWLGREHVEAFGASTELLVKLLDAGQRLPVHFHPDRAFAREHLGLAHGKTEAWIVLEADPGACVRLGFTETMPPERLRAMVAAGDSAGLLAALHERHVRPGDAFLVPAGVPHSIDPGVFVLELQEPSDLSIMLEAAGLSVRVDASEDALRALRCEALTPSEVDRLTGVPGEALLPPEADAYFRAHRTNAADAGFAVVVVIDGTGALATESGHRLEVRGGDVAVVPYAAGHWRLTGAVDAIACRPPLPGGHA